ncbi:MAG: hypothetical protein KGZ58_04390 [Ignavibacteriales bacterium]|nr:hypothetical protein [Ignavibacteriales bacterium]
MKSIIIILVLLLTAQRMMLAEEKQTTISKPKENSFMKTEFLLSKSELKAGEKTFIEVRFIPKEKIHVNIEVFPEFKIDSLAPISLLNNLIVPKDKDTTYMDVNKKLKQEIKVNAGVKKGNYTLKGTCAYLYCNEAEGWCNRFVQKFELPFVVK